MGNEFQNIIDEENLKEARQNLNEFTGSIKKKHFVKEIEEVAKQEIDEMQIGFINENPELSFEEMRLLKRFSDYMKGVR